MLYDVISELILPYVAIVVEVISHFFLDFLFFFYHGKKTSSAAEQFFSPFRKTQAPTVSQQSPFLDWRCLGIPSGKHTKNYWKWPFIVDFPIQNGDFP